METIMENKKHQNIPETGFVARNSDSVEDRRLVRFNQGAMFSFSQFSIFQFIAGHRLNIESSFPEEVQLLSKLAIFNMEVGFGAENSIDLTRNEVIILKQWLETRMQHCESERDSRVEFPPGVERHTKPTSKVVQSFREYDEGFNQKFNPDTYIGMKYLMLEVREWLFGEILD